MSVERTFYCEGPECERHATTQQLRHPMFLTIIEEDAEHHFCGWDCVLRYAGQKEPEEIIDG